VEEAAEAFGAALRDSTRRSVPKAGSVVVHLSAGLDSSGIAGSLGSLSRAELPGLAGRVLLSTATFPGLPCDETRLVRKIVEGLPFEWRSWSGLSPDLRDLAIETADIALPFGYGVVSWAANGDHLLAAQRGIRVVIQGHGGNQVATERGFWRDMRQSSGLGAFVRGVTQGDITMFRVPTLTRFRNLVRRFSPIRREPPAPEPIPEWVGPRLIDAWKSEDQDWRRFDAERRSVEAPSEMAREVWLAITSPTTFWELEVLDRRLGELGLEGRYPYLDEQLVAVALSIPPYLRPPRTGSRAIQRYALRRIVPKKVLRRRKNTTFDSAEIFHGRMAVTAMRAVLAEPLWRLDGLVDKDKTVEELNVLASGVNSSFQEWRRLRKICGLEVWLRRILG
jgi:asparagine synthetase B (glutamine-hydrolysing)